MQEGCLIGFTDVSLVTSRDLKTDPHSAAGGQRGCSWKFLQFFQKITNLSRFWFKFLF